MSLLMLFDGVPIVDVAYVQTAYTTVAEMQDDIEDTAIAQTTYQTIAEAYENA